MWILHVKVISLLLLISSTLSEAECPPTWFDCGNGQCLAEIWICDGENDCGNLNDEINCDDSRHVSDCLSSQFKCESEKQCIPERWHCDGAVDCHDGSDEDRCDNVKEDCAGFKCRDDQCIPPKWRCDGNEDCIDGSDEELCPQGKLCTDPEFLCSSGSCINKNLVCNGKNDCIDGSDEGLHCGDPCENLNCSQNCKKTPAGPECYCNDGYELNAKDNKTCNDIDECREEGFCSHECINTVGSYKCSCQDGYQQVNRTCKAKGAEPLLIFTTVKEVRGMRLRSNQYFLVRSVTGASAVDVDPKSREIYWVEISNRSTIYSAKIDGNGSRTILSHGLLLPEDIAVDYIGNNLYITDSGLRQVLTCKTDGTMCHVLHDTNVEKPRSIVLDPDEGLMYWSDWGNQTSGIYRSGMDGSRRIALVSNRTGWPNGIALDHTTNRLYWADAKLNTIEFITLDGSLRKVILNSTVFHPYSLAVFEDSIYWSDWSTFSLESCNKFTGHKMTIVARENGRHIMGVHVYHPVLMAKVSNPCWSSDCSHMCLISPAKGFACACPRGFKLSTDGKTCSSDICESTICSHSCKNTSTGAQCYCNDGYILDAKDKICIDIDECQQEHFCSHGCINTIGSYNCSCPDGYELVNRTCNIKSPDPLLIFSTIKEIRGINLRSNQDFFVRRTIARASAVGVDPKTERIYWVEISNRSSVYSAKTDGSDFRTILSQGLLVPEDIAVDYIANNLYITDSGLRQVLACKTLGTMCHVLHDTNVEKPQSVVLDPGEGLMYWSDWGEQSAGIYRSGMDGSRRISFVSSRVGWPNGIAIDHSKSRLYWADAKLNTIEFITLNGSVRKAILHSTQFQPNSLTVFEDKIYWTDWSFSLVFCDKFTCHNVTTLLPENSIGRIKIYSPALTTEVPNPCLNSNCSHLCLISPVNGFSCACPYWFQLSSDGRTCTDKEDGELLFVSDGPTILIKRKVTDDESLNLFPLSLDDAMITGVSYDSKMRRLFVADANKPAIYVVNITSRSVRDLVINRISSPEDLAFDWMSNNLYWVDSSQGTVEVISVNSLKRITLIKGLMRPMSLAISLYSGNMFVATPYNETPVAMYGMDGKHKRILHSVQGLPMSLAVRPSKSILYWADPRTGMISYVNYSSSSPSRILKSGMDGVMSIATSEENVYWTVQEKAAYEIPERLHVFHLSEQKRTSWKRVAYSPGNRPSEKSECLLENGGCSYLCLTSPNGRTCACSSAMTLAEDGETCLDKKCEDKDFKCMDGQCIPAELRCDGNKECSDGSDELDCDSNYCGNGLYSCKDGTCIHNYQVCDGISDCSNNEDEVNCNPVI